MRPMLRQSAADQCRVSGYSELDVVDRITKNRNVEVEDIYVSFL